jgi:hypothetical protein
VTRRRNTTRRALEAGIHRSGFGNFLLPHEVLGPDQTQGLAVNMEASQRGHCRIQAGIDALPYDLWLSWCKICNSQLLDSMACLHVVRPWR